jgi:hypothetical protein
MTAQDSDRKNVCGVQDFLWHVCAEIAHDFALIVLLPRFRVIMPVIDPVVKLLKDLFNQTEVLSCTI